MSTEPFVPSDLARYSTIKSLAASPTQVACVVSTPDEEADSNSTKIWLIPLDGGAPQAFTAGQDTMPKWSPDGTQLAFVSNRGNGLQAHVMPAHGGEAKPVTHMIGGVYTVEWSPDGQKLLLTAKQQVDPGARGERAPPPQGKAPQVVWRLPYKMDGLGFTLDREIHLFTVDKEGGDAVQLTDGPFDVRSAQYSPDGTRIAYTRTRAGREAHLTDVWVMDADGNNPVQLSTNVASAQYPVWSPDGRWIAFSGGEREGDSRSRLWLIDTRDGEVKALGDEALEVESGDTVRWSEDGEALYFIRAHHGLKEVASIRVADGSVTALVSGRRHILKLEVTEQSLIYAAAGIDQPTELFACGRDGAGEKCLTRFNAWWTERTVPRVEVRRFDVPDGKGGSEQIEGWLVLPSQGEGPFPLLLDVHGGPEAIAYVEYDKSPWRPVLCSRGWAVLALNPAGSSSYGLEFMRRILNHWGEIDLPQHLAAIKTLQDEGLIDDRLAIYGKSYGGYMSAWAIGHTDIFKAAVVSAPVADIQSHFGTSDTGFYVTPYSMAGEPYMKGWEDARRVCPLDHMHKARTPTLLLQGADDQRCPIGQSEEIFATLMRSSDVAVEMILYPGGDHHLVEEGSPSFRIDYVSRLIEWIERFAGQREGGPGPNSDKPTQSSSAPDS
jgi:dipeptidyl aminopeptidase/acylaminoacyl peptidase